MKNRTDRIYYAVIILVISGIYLVTAGQLYGIFFPPDEYGYWANAAALSGKDWSEVSALQSYYSFGYSLLLIPLMGLIKDTVFLYRAAILLNIIFACVHGVLLYQILKQLFGDRKKELLVVAGCAGAFYPSVIVYSHYTMAEVLLNLLFVLLIYEALLFINRPGKAAAVLLGLTMGFTYYVHMRTLGILCALVLMLCLLAFQKRELRKYLMVILSAAAICLVAGALMKGYLQDTLYYDADAGLLGKNDYSGQLEKMKYLFSGKGILDFMISFLGKLFYLGNTTFGLFYWGMFVMLKNAGKVIRKIRNKEATQNLELLYIFLAGSVLFTCLISAYYMIAPGRVDSILYGRYNEIVVPLIVCIGIIEMMSTAYLKKGTALFIAFHAVCATVLNLYISAREVTTYLPDFAVGIAYAAGMHPKTTGDIINYPYIVGSLISIGIAYLFYMVREKKLSYTLLGILAAVNLCIGIRILWINVLPHQRDNLGNMEIAGTIEEIDTDNREIYLLHSEWNEYIDVIQYYLPDKRIHVIREEELDMAGLGKEDIILVYRPDERKEALEMFYNSRQDVYHMTLFFNELNKVLE